MKKILVSVLAATVLLTSLTACNATEAQAPANESPIGTHTISPSPDVVLATARNVQVDFRDFTFFKQASRMEVEQQALMFGITDEENLAELWAEEIEEGFTMWDSLSGQSLETAKRLAVLHNLAVEAGTQLPEFAMDQMQQGLESFLASLAEDRAEAEEIFQEFYGVSAQHALEVELRMSLIDTFLHEYAHALVITEEDIRAVYDMNPNAFDQVTVRHVLISSTSYMTEEEQEQARERAEEIYRRIVAGEAIGELASIYSEDPGSAQNNGEYTIPMGMMVAPFENWAFSAGEGDKGIVLTQFGYHVMQFMSRTGFEDVKDSIHHSLQHTRADENISQILEEFDGLWVVNQELLDQ